MKRVKKNKIDLITVLLNNDLMMAADFATTIIFLYCINIPFLPAVAAYLI